MEVGSLDGGQASAGTRIEVPRKEKVRVASQGPEPSRARQPALKAVSPLQLELGRLGQLPLVAHEAGRTPVALFSPGHNSGDSPGNFRSSGHSTSPTRPPRASSAPARLQLLFIVFCCLCVPFSCAETLTTGGPMYCATLNSHVTRWELPEAPKCSVIAPARGTVRVGSCRY